MKIRDKVNNIYDYSSPLYEKVDGIYGYIVVDIDSNVLFYYEDSGIVSYITLQGWEVVLGC